MRNRLLVLLAAVAGLFGGLASAPSGTPLATTPAAYAKSCSPGWKHAIVGGEHKCLRAGQFCAKQYESTYRRYGYTCKPGSDGRSRLKRR